MRWNSFCMLCIFRHNVFMTLLLLEQLFSLYLHPDASQSLLPFSIYLLWNPVSSFHCNSSHLGRYPSSLASLLFPEQLMTPLSILPCLLSPRTSVLVSNFISSFHACFLRQVLLFLNSPSIKERKPVSLLNIMRCYRISKFHNIKM